MRFKKGDKVKYTGLDNIGTVMHDQVPYNTVVGVQWDNGTTTTTHEKKLTLVQTQISINPKEVVSVPKEFLYKEGDRVRLKWKGEGGTILIDQRPEDKNVKVHWDRTDKKIYEHASDLIALYTPRQLERPKAIQDAIDLIEGERDELKKQVEALQFRLGRLTKSKKLLEEQ